MSLALRQSDFFLADLRKQVDWYRDNASPDVAEQYVSAVQATLQKLAETPGSADRASRTGSSWQRFIRGACNDPTIAI